ncbi:MAG: tripartite tricarboxylate transporter substrate binding protein [Burkholderiales bacterium]|nr:tripartite tricarboxylate transporter substrate binding protein [Burkholderiales bacterium]
MRTLRTLAALLLGVIPAPAAWAQAYPAKPIRLIIPFPPGGSNDIVGRMVGAQLGQRLGQQVIVDNRGGAGGVIGTEAAARSQPDGYTLLIVSIAYAYNPSLYKLNFDPVKSLAAISLLGSGPNALAVHPSLPVKSARELIALAKAKPGELLYASAGVGTFQHLGSELFRMMAGIKLVHVPFKGGGPATVDVISGNTQISIGSLIQTLPHIRSGRLKALGTGGAKRVAALPDVPTISESGLPGYEANNWWGMMAPAGTPAAVLKRLSEELAAIVNSPETQKRFSAEGAESRSMSPEAFTKYIASEMTKWSKVVREAGIKAE